MSNDSTTTQATRRPDASTNVGLWEGTSQAGNEQVALSIPGMGDTIYCQKQATVAQTDKGRGPDFKDPQGSVSVWKYPGTVGARYSVSIEGMSAFSVFTKGFQK